LRSFPRRGTSFGDGGALARSGVELVAPIKAPLKGGRGACRLCLLPAGFSVQLKIMCSFNFYLVTPCNLLNCNSKCTSARYILLGLKFDCSQEFLKNFPGLFSGIIIYLFLCNFSLENRSKKLD
jgi:hypothetical protein